MKIVAALFITAAAFLTASVPVNADTTTVIPGYTALRAPAGTTTPFGNRPAAAC
jgi:hypothetical protein